MREIDFDDLITKAEAARIRDVSRQAIGDLIARGRLKTIEVAGMQLLSRTEVENFQVLRAAPPKQKPEDLQPEPAKKKYPS